MGGLLNGGIAFALIAGGWWAIVDLLGQSLRRDDARAPIRRPLPANRILSHAPRVAGPLNRAGRRSIEMSDLTQ